MAERTSLDDRTHAHGAEMMEVAGWLVPARYGPADYQTTREQAGLFDVSHHGKVEVAGREAPTFLHNLCTNEVGKLPAGAGCEAFLTSGQAKVVGHAFISRLAGQGGPDVFGLDVGPGMGEKVLKHLDRHLISEQVELADRTRDFAQMHLAGPRATEALGRVFPDLPPLRELQHAERTAGSTRCVIRRHDLLGLPGYDLFCPAAEAGAVWDSLTAADARPAGLEAYQALRVEAGTPMYGLDIDETNLPQEVGRDDRAISFTKGCYIGQETVARIRTYGRVNRLLVGLRLSAGEPVPHGAKVLNQGKEVGQVTSSVLSPLLGTAIALAYVRRGSHGPGTALEVEAAEGPAAEVVALPFRSEGA